MSVYELNRLGYRVLRDDDLCDALKADPETTLRAFDLTPPERAALLEGDVAALYHLGAHEYLMWNFARMGVFGLDPKSFGDRMRVAGERRLG
jgi:hypothetical protein